MVKCNSAKKREHRSGGISMKKKTPSTFILNVEDKNYFFVEGKISPFYGPVYNVYYDADDKPAFYTAKNFVEEHGINTKIPVSKFIKHVNSKLTLMQGTNIHIDNACMVLSNIDHKIQVNGERKALKKEKSNLINAIDVYNNVRHLLPGEIEISYEEDYELITSKKEHKIVKSVEHKEERRVVKQISNNYENAKGIQRKLKYD